MRYESGEISRNGRISKRGDKLTRTHLYEAANVILTRQDWLLFPEGLGPADCQGRRLQEGEDRGGAQACRHPPRHVETNEPFCHAVAAA
ncbi:transposase [Allomesorhizobium camelthorni]|uniref:transposase n=1 Tax=Allomesorhizobium camelthorni TaxID=475069 RepID=UPI0019811BE5